MYVHGVHVHHVHVQFVHCIIIHVHVYLSVECVLV